MATVVTLAEAKTNLRITDAGHDPEVQAAVADADGIVRAYLADFDVPEWDETTAPPPIKRAVLLLVTQLYEDRGDVMGHYDTVWAAIKSILVPWRTPTLA